MATIDTKVGNLEIPNGSNLKPINERDEAFQLKLKTEMLSVQNRLKSGTIGIARVYYLSTNDLATLLNGGGEALIFYHTDGGGDAISTFTVISADENLDPMIGRNDQKWRLSTRLEAPPLGPLPLPGWKTNDLTLDSIYNFALSAHDHTLETGDFLTILIENNAKVLAEIQEGFLHPLRIAAVIKKDLEAYKIYPGGILIYLNYAAQERLAPVVDANDIEKPEKKQFISLSFLGVQKQANGTLEVVGDLPMTLRGFCPPDCHVYNNNVTV
jgi:hypothetical protein